MVKRIVKIKKYKKRTDKVIKNYVRKFQAKTDEKNDNIQK